jgi:hypothetical protein
VNSGTVRIVTCWRDRRKAIALRFHAPRKPWVTILAHSSNACVRPLAAADKTSCFVRSRQQASDSLVGCAMISRAHHCVLNSQTKRMGPCGPLRSWRLCLFAVSAVAVVGIRR